MSSDQKLLWLIARRVELRDRLCATLRSLSPEGWSFQAHGTVPDYSTAAGSPRMACVLVEQPSGNLDWQHELIRLGHRFPGCDRLVVSCQPKTGIGTIARALGAAQTINTGSLDDDASIDCLARSIEGILLQRGSHHQQTWYNVAVSEGNVGLWWWDREQSYFYLAEHFQTMLKLAPHQLPQSLQEWIDRIHPEDRAQVLAAAEAHFVGQTERFRVSHRVRRGDGTYLWLVSSGRVAEDDPGRRRILGASIDVSEQKLVERDLAQAKRDAEAAVDAKNQFLTKMSHELRTPLTAISGYADLLLDYIRDEDALEPIMSIRRNGQHLLRALNDILNLAHIEQGRIQLEPRAVEIRTMVRNVLDGAGVRAAAKGIPIHMDLSPDLPRIVHLDPVRVCQVLTQLLGNAIKYTELGRITVSVDCHRGSESLLRFKIQDTGIGIAQDRLEAIFEPFCQADDSMTRRHTGSGLGLSLCRQLSRLLGGKLSVESTPGNGSTFQLVIPLEAVTTSEDKGEGEAKEVPASTPSATEPQNLWAGIARPPLNCRILLVEDGIDNRRLISLILRKAGAQVEMAENGQVGVEMALATFPGYGNRHDDPHEPFDLILMDMQMPILDGYDATRQLRSAGFVKPIIALTAHALPGDREKCLAAGCDDYATKPIHRENLLELLRLYADKSRELENTPGVAYENTIETA